MRRNLLISWGVLSLIWISFIGFIAFYENGWGLFVIPVPPDETPSLPHYVSVESETKAGPEPKGRGGMFRDDAERLRFMVRLPNRKMEPGSAELLKVRSRFPSYRNASDEKFSEHLWVIVQKEALKDVQFQTRMIFGEWEEKAKRAKAARIEGPVFALAPPLTILILGLAITSVVRRYQPSQLSPSVKKVVAVVITWLVGATSWVYIWAASEEEDFSYALDMHLPLLFLPPIVFIIGITLWRWAKRSPTDRHPQG